MSAALVQHKEQEGISGNIVLVYTGITAGNTLLVMVNRESGSGTISSVSDNVNAGNYTSILDPFTGEVLAFVKRNVLSGNTTITGVASVGGDVWNASSYEISGCDNVAAILSGSQLNSPDTNNHVSTSIAISGPGFAACSAEFSGGTDWTPGSGWATFNTTISSSGVNQHKILTESSDTGPFSTTSAITTAAIMIMIPEVSSGALPFITQVGAIHIR